MELLAYFASFIVLISFMVKDVTLLRILNNVGCVLFLIYASYHGRYPLIFLNSMVILVNMYYILKKKK
jgi:hypothetical protein